MALYKDYDLAGTTITVNTDSFRFIINHNGSLWFNDEEGNQGRIYMTDVGPKTEVSVRNKDGSRTRIDHVWLS